MKINTIITKYIWTLHIIHIIKSVWLSLDVFKSTDRMANSIDPDQFRSSLSWVYTVCSALLVEYEAKYFISVSPEFFTEDYHFKGNWNTFREDNFVKIVTVPFWKGVYKKEFAHREPGVQKSK